MTDYEKDQIIGTYQSLESPINQHDSSLICKESPMLKIKRNRFKQYPYRWVNLYIYILTALSNSILIQTFSPIAEIVQNLYGVPQFVVNFSTLVFYLVCPIAAPFVNKILDEYGLKRGFTVAAIIQIVGSGVRILVKYSFYYALLGQIINSFSIMFVLASPAKFSATWFTTRTRPMVTTAGAFAVVVSGVIGIIIPTTIIDKNSDKQDIQNLMWLEFILVVIVWTLNIIIFKNKPPTPPSYSASVKKDNLKQSTKALLKNKNYLLLFISYSMFLGTLNAFTVMVSYYIEPFGYVAQDASKIMFCATLSGLIGCIVGGFTLQKFKKYKLQGSILNILVMIFISVQFYFLYEKITWALYVVSCFFGFTILPIYPVLIEFSAELVFPVGEGTATGWLQAGGQLYSFVVGIILSSFMNGQQSSRSFYGFIYYFCNILGACLLLFVVKEDLKRLKEEILSVLDKPISKENLQSIIEGKTVPSMTNLDYDLKKSLREEKILF